jgi:hypothetical protein
MLIYNAHRLLIGVSAATVQERPFFVGQLTRIAASFGGYHLEMLSSEFGHLPESVRAATTIHS